MEFIIKAVNEQGNPLNCGSNVYPSLAAANVAARDISSDCEIDTIAVETTTGWRISVGFPTGITVVVISEQHTLLKEQLKLLLWKFGSFYTLKVPATGWDIDQQREVLQLLAEQTVVFVSPIPWLLKETAAWQSLKNIALSDGGCPTATSGCLVMANDTREKKELPSGKVVYTVPATGWYIA